MKPTISLMLCVSILIVLTGCSDVPTEQSQTRDTQTRDTQTKETQPGDAPKSVMLVTDGSPEYSASHVAISGRLEPAVVERGGKTNLIVTATPKRGWHVYAWEKKVPESSISKPTLIVLDPTSPFVVETASADTEVIEKNDEVLKTVSRFHLGPVTWKIPIVVHQDVEAGEHAINGWVGFQVCSDDNKLCDMPDAARFSVALRVTNQGSSGSSTLSFESAKYKDVSEAAESASK